MTRIVITGGTGFIGRRLVLSLLAKGEIRTAGGRVEPIEKLTIFDAAPAAPPLPQDRRLHVVTGDIADPAFVRTAIAAGTNVVFHLAAIVSGQAEADMDIGLRVNLDGTRNVLDACRALGTHPRLVFASSIAVYGGDMPAECSEATALTPQTSYGAQKACGELLVNDYSRKGYLDGCSLRLPTIIVRPGRPNRAASGFASSIIREPLAGCQAVCPVAPEAVMPVMSPRRVVSAFEAAAALPGPALGHNRTLQLPGLRISVAEMVDALRRAGGDAAVKRIMWQPDPLIQRMVDGWPQGLDGRRAESLGIEGDRSIDEIVRAFIDDDLPAQMNIAAG